MPDFTNYSLSSKDLYYY